MGRGFFFFAKQKKNSKNSIVLTTVLARRRARCCCVDIAVPVCLFVCLLSFCFFIILELFCLQMRGGRTCPHVPHLANSILCVMLPVLLKPNVLGLANCTFPPPLRSAIMITEGEEPWCHLNSKWGKTFPVGTPCVHCIICVVGVWRCGFENYRCAAIDVSIFIFCMHDAH